MLNAFPQRSGNPDLLLKTFEETLKDIPAAIICDTAKKFTMGEAENQNLAFSPSIAEFTAAAKKLAELRRSSALMLPRGDEIPTEPIDRKIQRVRASYASRELIESNCSIERFKQLCEAKKLPDRCEYVGLLGEIYAA